MDWIVNIIFLLFGLLALLAGDRSSFSIDKLSGTVLLNSLLAILIFFTILMLLHVIGLFPQSVAAPFMSLLYSSLAGFFTGYAIRLFRIRKKMGALLYQHRSFWTDHAPVLFSIILIIYGLFRTAILTEQAITEIRVTSGLSLMAFGFVIWVLKTVPEFRSKGILLLDREIEWQDVLSWSWKSETVIAVEYIPAGKDWNEGIRQFLTSVPEEERKELETILKSKMDDYSEKRKKRLFPEEKE